MVVVVVAVVVVVVVVVISKSADSRCHAWHDCVRAHACAHTVGRHRRRHNHVFTFLICVAYALTRIR